LRSGQPEDRQPVRAAQLVQVQCAPAAPRRTAEQRTADAAAGSMNRRIRGVQLRRSRRSARRSRS
jgi:hypothetical protein